MIYTEETFVSAMESEYRFAESIGEPVKLKPSLIIHRENAEYDEYLEQTAAHFGYSIFNITYNHCTFGGAADIVAKATLILNPYYQFALPLPIIPKFKKVVKEILELPQYNVEDGYQEIHLTDDEWKLVKLLPNGWSSSQAVTYLELPATRPFYRLSANLPLYGHLMENCSLLHPWKAREIRDNELTALIHCEFFKWLESVIAGLQVLAKPWPQSNDFDLSGNQYKPAQCSPVYGTPAFCWHNIPKGF